MTNKLRVNCLAKGAILVSIIIMIGLPVAHLIRTWAQDQDSIEPVRASYADDLSRLNATRVQEVWALPRSSLDAEQQLIALLNRARKSQLPVSIAGARHSMGGHVIAPDGIVIDMLPFHSMSLNDDASVLTVQAGALWSEVIPFLDRHGRSVAVMQSDSSFSIGGSLSVNAHGWQVKRPPIVSSVKSFRLLTADGRIVRCSREENPQLFWLKKSFHGITQICSTSPFVMFARTASPSFAMPTKI